MTTRPAAAPLLLWTIVLALPLPLAAGAAPLPVVGDSDRPHPEARLAKGKFLVANRSLRDPNFAEAVVLLVEYDEDGALGVVVNRPTEVPLIEALPDIKELRKRKDRVHLGGPVARDRMVLLLRAQQAPPDSVPVFDSVYASGSLDALRQVAARRAPNVRAYAGYAGWGPGQLDAEVVRGDWLIGPADSKSIFDDPADGIWQKLVERFTGDWALAPHLQLASD